MKKIAAPAKIYVRETAGRYTNWRWTCIWLTQLVFYGLPWLSWNGRQLVWFDLAARQFHVFGIVLWPQDLIYLAALLIICVLTLFLSSALVGRVWCGFACPHSVYTEIFMWIERKIEGGRSARMRLDQDAWSLGKFWKKTLKHGAWVLFACWTGISLVAYFTPIQVLLREMAGARLSGPEVFWIALYAGLTYGNAGWIREKICRQACPYSPLQSAMIDRDTLVMHYDAARGEPRGLRNRKRSALNLPQGDCVDCTLCIQVCPTGSDIRQGWHADCMGCAACIDACNLVMDKIGAARGLIRYASGNAIDLKLSPRQIRQRMLRPRVLIYMTMLLAMGVALAGSLIMRAPLKLDVMRDRGVLLREPEERVIENVYRLTITNTDERAHRYRIAVSGIDTVTVAGAAQLSLEGTTSRILPVRVRIAHGKGHAGSNEIVFTLQDLNDGNVQVTEKAVFVVPVEKS